MRPACQSGQLCTLLRSYCKTGAADAPALARYVAERHEQLPLYMAAMSAITHNPKFKAIYQDTIQQGKEVLFAVNAVIRKMMIIINAKIRDAQIA